jgi:hypothetical protein
VPGIARLAEDFRVALTSFDPALSSGRDCATLAEMLARTAKACAAASARAAARAADCGVHKEMPDASAAEWLARVSGGSAAAARDAMEAAREIDAHPATRDALAAGEVSSAQASQIMSVPGAEDELLALAKSSSLGAVRDAARKKRLAAIPANELRERQRAARRLSFWRDELGMLSFRGSALPEVGVAFTTRLERIADRLWREAQREGRDESREALLADAFAELISAEGSATRGATDVVVVVDVNALRRGSAKADEPCHVIGGGPIPVDLARELSKDAFLKAVIHDGVAIHTVAHFGRRRPAALDTALMLGGAPIFEGVACVEDGCERRYGLQWDHIDPVANGGLTSLTNLQAECTPHHKRKTERDRSAGLLAGAAGARSP